MNWTWEKIKLSKIDTDIPKVWKKMKLRTKQKELVAGIGQICKSIYAEKKHSVLIVLQGMDASGKDSVAQNVFGRVFCSPAIDACSFKNQPKKNSLTTSLWRVLKLAPAKGNMKIFIRSHYEDILIQSVHQWIDKDRVTIRMNAINAFEELLQFDNNTTILKFYLHISHSKQLEKLKRRDNPQKQWKFNEQDFEESKLWDEYMECYEYAINNSTIPWHIIPADQNWYRDYSVAQIVLETP